MVDAKHERSALIWLDLEMSGLNPDVHKILEVAAIVSDFEFNEMACLETVVFQPREVLQMMDDWCQNHHAQSGLTARVPHGLEEHVVDEKLCALLDDPRLGEGRPILAGNSIAQDRKFVDRYLPKFAARLHYRMLDVSSFKIVFEGRVGFKYPKKNAHRALDDIRESMDELRFYLKFVDFQAALRQGESRE